MTIAVGHILDKYELIEKVGQGGMAVVYKGMDRSLRRAVAVKVLHKHLADHQEARDRFEREAHAVAKLRHENILEIFDFSGKDSDESYIVTEFIDGQTLKEFIGEHPIKYPEIGAMIVVQVCRALSHAHSLGVLHRDVKPENIMIRTDGIVKLTDFGIAQMLDMQRMTVTGQLLGSPAYMSPEHVEGGRLDFRTDVFAVGIVLYQLVVGELPFQGKNPHEILKRIAECAYPDPQKKNPLIGNELCRILRRSLARDPDDRYADITEMLGALDAYLTGSGLGDSRKELARFFAAPVSYEVALRERLLDHLCRRGRELLATDQVAALELLNRVLTLEPEHRESLEILSRLSRRRRSVRMAAVTGGVIVLILTALGLRALRDDEPTPAETMAKAQEAGASGSARQGRAMAGGAVGEPDPGGMGQGAPGEPDEMGDASVLVDASARTLHESDVDDRTSRTTLRPLPLNKPVRDPDVARDTADAGQHAGSQAGHVAVTTPKKRVFTLTVAPRKSEYRVGQGLWHAIDGSAIIEVGPGEHEIEVRNDTCCQATGHTIKADHAGGPIHVTLGYLPASITPVCNKPDISVQIDGVSARLDRKFAIPITGMLGRRTVKVTFIGERTDEHTLQLRYNEDKDVTCSFE